jgi:alanine-synthesizing transaminase
MSKVDFGPFPRVDNSGRYILEVVTQETQDFRRNDIDVVSLGMGKPDGATPRLIVDKLIEAARKTKNHTYSASAGIPNLRKAIANLYQRRYSVQLDPKTEAIATIGAKDAVRSFFNAVLNPNGHDRVVSTNPAYPVHYYAVVYGGGIPVMLPLFSPEDFLNRLENLFRKMAPKRPRAILLSFPHNPTTICVDLSFFEAIIAMAMKHGTMVVHDFAYADGGFDGYVPPSILQVKDAKEVAVEVFSLSKSYNMAG